MIVKPFLKFPGGKGFLVDILISHFPKKFNRYFEPMVGGGALFFELASRGIIDKQPAVISDINPWLMETYRSIAKDPQKVIMQLKLLRETHQRYVEKYGTAKKFYLKVRKYANRQLPPDGAFTIYLSKTCFNGLFRFNKKGQFNAPFGDQKNPSLFDTKNIVNISTLLNKTAFSQTEYSVCVREAKKRDLVYFDPPYWPVKDTSFTSYSQFGFSKDDHIKLAKVAKHLRDKGVYTIISNSDTPEVHKLYKDFNLVSVQVPRRINSNGQGRGKVKELIIKSF
jgi:DNA adenine methylase